MTKTELIDAIASGVDGLTKAKAEQALNVTLAAIMESVGKGDAVSLIGFGTFSQGERAERMARNPRTGETVYVAEKHAPFFKTGKELRVRLNGGDDDDLQPKTAVKAQG